MNIDTHMVSPDTEEMIEINWDTREIIVPDNLQNIGVNGDNNAETVFIKSVDSFDGVSLENKTVSVWFKNAKGETYYTTVSSVKHEENNLIFEWNIDERLTRYAGKVQFQIQITSPKYILNSLYSELNVLSGMNLNESFPVPDESVILQLTRRLSDVELSLFELTNTVTELTSLNEKMIVINGDIAQMKAEISYLKENVVYIPN